LISNVSVDNVFVSFIDVVVARQAIFDAELDVIGYELLFRSLKADAPRPIDGDLMTTSLLYSSMNIGIERLVGNNLIFCNADRGLLLGEVPITLPPERTVIEVLETVTPDAEILAGCRRLTDAGYRLALDDFLWFPGAEDLLSLATIVSSTCAR
jgi:EAL and modified HD-GYP domain-containing signal transduction protein